MSFRIEKPKEKKINSRKINDTNDNNILENKENIEINFNITNYKYKSKNNIKKINKTTDKKDIKTITINFPNKKLNEKTEEKERETIIYFDISKIENNVQIPRE